MCPREIPAGPPQLDDEPVRIRSDADEVYGPNEWRAAMLSTVGIEDNAD